MWQSVLDAYRERIVEAGRQPLFLLLFGLVGSFLFIRFSVRMIRRGTSWWPGNVTPGGLHIHHVVFGQALMLVCGVGGFTIRGEGGVLREAMATGFGIGCGLVLDEFALVLHLEDVYWSEQGRKSVDAVIIAVAMIGLLLFGALPLGGFTGRLTLSQSALAVLVLLLVVVSLFKGKIYTGLLGVMLWPLALVGAVRLARPRSPWARWRYRSRPKRMARAERRDARIHQRLDRGRVAFYNVLAGAPDVVLGPQPRTVPGPQPEPPAPVPALPYPPGPVPAWRGRCIGFAQWYLRIAALLNLAAGLIAPFRNQVHRANTGEYFTPALMTAGFTAALFAGLLALMLRRRKRAAWMVATVVVAGYTALCTLALVLAPEDRSHPFNWGSAALTVAVLTALVLGRPACRVRGERGNLVLGLGVLLVGGAAVTGIGAALVRVGSAGAAPGWGDSAVYVLIRLVTLSGIVEYSDLDVPGWVALTVNVLGAALLLLTVRVFFRSPRSRVHLGPEDERRLRALLARHGARDSLGYFALRRDKSVCWSPSGKAAVLYRVVNGVALASGDPVGDPEAWPQAIGRWREEVRDHAWVPAVTGAGEQAGIVYRREAGLRALEFGDEAVVEAEGFTLAGRSMRTLRQTHQRVRRAGYRAVIRRHRDIPAEELTALARLADAWRHGRTERGFSMALGRLGDPADGDCLLIECRDENDRTSALLSFVPWGAHGLSLDLMRRDRESDNGLVEFMVAELLTRASAGELPVTRVSLNFAMFRYVFEHGARIGAGPVLRLSRTVLRFLSRWWQLESLYRANAKYQPAWEPRFLLYEKSSELPAIALANALAEGFLTRPRLRRSAGEGRESLTRSAQGGPSAPTDAGSGR
ncbi:phosphatidylglycerol lysyltransferase domain-containing protein [Saccharothrix sp. ST-888]|uniref:phosphatidylglycerol lysyltransferase domain-containing protein n=1 Tax=Saccharothrix sp. ST-888 TaxID=1427391 RepID=UPI0007C7E7F0|nr:phosphatidylglycerol lysyltransferase domain-containing protein [Saccharothrix sp. ST-888]